MKRENPLFSYLKTIMASGSYRCSYHYFITRELKWTISATVYWTNCRQIFREPYQLESNRIIWWYLCHQCFIKRIRFIFIK